MIAWDLPACGDIMTVYSFPGGLSLTSSYFRNEHTCEYCVCMLTAPHQCCCWASVILYPDDVIIIFLFSASMQICVLLPNLADMHQLQTGECVSI